MATKRISKQNAERFPIAIPLIYLVFLRVPHKEVYIHPPRSRHAKYGRDLFPLDMKMHCKSFLILVSVDR
jgi:hypothetical protein